MDDLSDLISPDAAFTGVAVPNKKALLQQLAASAAGLTGLEARVIVERLLERERLGSTGFGGGVAIPHGKMDGRSGWWRSSPIRSTPVVRARADARR